MSSDWQIIYATTSGNVEYVCESIAKYLKDLGIVTTLYRSELLEPNVLKNNSNFIFATSTWEHGVINPNFIPTLDQIQSQDCGGKTACFIGLGDTRYEPVLFCEGIEIVKTNWEKSGGAVLGEVLKIDGEPHPQIGQVEKWLIDLDLKNV